MNVSIAGVRPTSLRRLLLLLLLGFPATLGGAGSCSGGKDSGSGVSATFAISPSRQRARVIDDFLINYGPWDDATIQIAQRHQLVVVHPKIGNLTRDVVARIQKGVNPSDPADDVLVLAYVSIGEDLRTKGLSDQQLAQDPRFRGDGTGPRVDPRGHLPQGGPLQGIDPLGAPSPGGSGYASYYLDDNSIDATGRGDGIPDRNAVFGACFVNAGDPAWYSTVDAMTLDGPDNLSGFQEALTLNVGRGLGCDGVFLDTVDTCAPNSFTDPSSPNPSKFEWTAPGFQSFIRRLRTQYPNAVVLQNRGLFFFDPRHPHYQFTTRSLVDVVQFESFRLNSNAPQNIDPLFYADNSNNVAPKLMAEANRPDGFRVVSLGYAADIPGVMSIATLTGGSTLGLPSLLEDIRVTERVNGFRHYFSDSSVQTVNSFVHDHADRSDNEPPVWSSTFNAHDNISPPGPPDPRVGIQSAEAGPGSIIVRWDVALDLNRVKYALYLQTTPFDFTADPRLSGATRIVLEPVVPKNYGTTALGPTIYANQATIGGLARGQLYYAVIRAFDTSPAANEEQNQVVLSATPF
jgi:hypothetical protein